MSGLTDNLGTIAEHIRQTISTIDSAREKVLPLCREAIRHCSNAIRAVHRQEFNQAGESLQSAHALLGKVEEIVVALSGMLKKSLPKVALPLPW